jgi:large subunit ribosomal protein L15
MKLNELTPSDTSRKARKRVGRGVGSGNGKTAGRGTKGHKSRSGGGVRPGFEGGQMPLHRRLPKRGFTNIFKKKIAVINIADLAKMKEQEVIDEATVRRSGFVKGKFDGIKLLGKGNIDFAANIRLNAVSQSAREKIEAAGGKIEVI